MDITLEQARVFESVVRLGTIQKASAELNRGHSAVIYSLKCLEEQTGLVLFDRGGYRNRITGQGEVALKFCRRLLETHQEFTELCRRMSEGWEPSLKLVYDEVVNFDFIGSALSRLNKISPPTEVKILSAHLGEVEDVFNRDQADVMVTILPLQRLQIPSRKLRPIQMHLVAHREHPLCEARRKKWSIEELNRHTFVTISSAPGQIGLGTEQMKFDSYFFVDSFANKKSALVSGLGFGWLPDYLIQSELKKGVLRNLKTEIDNTHTLLPRLYYRPLEKLGKAAHELVTLMSSDSV